jgi:hypothetical protein
MRISEILESYIMEEATAGATSSGSIATVANPSVAIGNMISNVSYTGMPGKSGTSAPTPPKVFQPKSKEGTATNALDLKTNIFGGTTIKR